MNLPLFIARRMTPDSGDNRPGIMVRIASAAVSISLAVMLLSIAVIRGFKTEISRRLVGFAAHTEVADIRSMHSMESAPVTPTPVLEKLLTDRPGLLSIAPYAAKGGIVRTDDGMQGILLKGIDPRYDTRFLASLLVEGELPRCGDSVRHKDVLLSLPAARRLNVAPGDKVELLFVEEDAAPRRDRFKVSGLYVSGMAEIDDLLAVTDIRNVQRLMGWTRGEVSGYELMTTSLAEAASFSAQLNRDLLYAEDEETVNLVATSIMQRYPWIFDWLRTHDVNAVVILTIMLLVALFNMTSVLLISVLERTRMIGLLKALGMNDVQLQRVFLCRAGFIMLRGMVWGNLIALTLCLVQRYGHVVKLDAAGYLLSEVPVSLGVGWWLGVNAGAALLILLLLALPAWMVSFVRPDESIRYE